MIYSCSILNTVLTNKLIVNSICPRVIITFYRRISTCPTLLDNKCGSEQSGSKHKITFKPYMKPCTMDHDHKNMALNRPMSPHLDIYGPTLPAMTSIAQRATGVVLVFYALMMAGGALFMPCGIDSYILLIQSLNLPDMLIMILKFFIGFPFAYHYFIGIRFACFNMVKLLHLNEAYQSAYIAIASAVATAAMFAVVF